MVRDQGVLPGQRALVCGAGEEAEAMTALLRSMGCEVVATVGLRPGPTGHIVRARGRGRVAGAIVQDANGAEHRLRCDLIAVADHHSAFVDLARHAGAHVAWRPPHGFAVATEGGATTAPGVFACGEVAGAQGLAASAAGGEEAGRAAAAYLLEEAS
jgi:thioredoxin reductase